MKRIVLLLFLFISVSKIGASQASDLGNWIAYIGTYDVSKKVNLQLVTQTRFHNIIGDWDQYLLRIGANHKLDNKGNYSLGMGVDYFYNDKYIGNTDFKNSYDEFRIYEQFVTKSDYKRFYFQHRYRLENRFFKKKDVKFRFRYLLQAKIALNKKRLTKDTWYLALLNEAFINLAGPNHFDRDWFQYTIGYKLNKSWAFEIGAQTQFTGNGKYNTRLQFWTFHNMNWQKKKQPSENARGF